MIRRPLLALIAGACASAAAVQVSAACRLEKVAETPVTMVGPRPTVTVKINGRAATMMVDSGAFFSGVSDEAASRFAMTPIPVPSGMWVHGVGGREQPARAARAADFEFAGRVFKDHDFLVGGRLAGAGIDGMLGENVLGVLEVEYDLANGAIRFFKAVDCSKDSKLAYWSAGLRLSRVSLESDRDYLTQLVGRAKLNGQGVRAVFDSGSPLTVVSRNAAARAGVSASSPGVVPGGAAYGTYGAGVESLIAPFESLAVGEEEIRNINLHVADISLNNGDMLLGVEFFLTHRILVSGSQRRIYFTPYAEGQPERRSAAAPAPAELAQAPAVKGPATASEFSRRAAAAVSRGDFRAAIEDLGRAIDLQPDESQHYVQRASARLGLGESGAALADLNRALALKPQDAQALLLRGQIHALSLNTSLAKADFDAAIALRPNDSTLPLKAAETYMRFGAYAEAIRMFDGWLATFPTDESAVQVIGMRCSAHAVWGQELPAGLADCDLALRRDGKLSTVMENRGVILLRLGRLDEAIAQFDAALRAQPKAPWSLYGRGLAKLRKGAKTQGDADIAAAVALYPDLMREARRYGLGVDAEKPGG